MTTGRDGDDAAMRAVALAGRRSGKSQRQIGVDLFGVAQVDAEWSPDGWMRARVSRPVVRARAEAAPPGGPQPGAGVPGCGG